MTIAQQVSGTLSANQQVWLAIGTTLASLLIAGIGIWISDRRSTEANRIAKEKADEANAIIKATAEEASRTAKEANRIAKEALEYEKKRDQVALEFLPTFESEYHRSHGTTAVQCVVIIRNTGRQVHIASALVINPNGKGILLSNPEVSSVPPSGPLVTIESNRSARLQTERFYVGIDPSLVVEVARCNRYRITTQCGKTFEDEFASFNGLAEMEQAYPTSG